MHSDIDLGPERPSRLSRVMVLVATLGVAIIAAWVVVPILLADYVGQTATTVVAAKPRALAQRRVASTSAPTETLAATPASAAAAPPPADTTGSVQRDDAAPPSGPIAAAAAAPVPAVAPPLAAGFNTIASAMPWPSEPPATQPQPAAPAQAMRLASAPSDLVDATVKMPLPRSRPSRTIAARLAIPLPRPRPEIASEGPTPEEQAFERDVERMR